MSRGAVIAVLLAVLLPAALFAQQQTSTLPETSRSTFLKLTRVQELWEEENYAQAITDLEEYYPEVADDPYEYALTNQYLAHTRILADDNAGARVAVERALAAGELPLQMRADLDLFYGQLLIGDEEYVLAKTHLERWLETTQKPPYPGQLFYAAYASYMTDDLPRARMLIERTLEEAGKPNDQWNRIYYQILFDLGEYDLALDVIMAMLERTPSNDGLWRLLVNHFMQREENREALAAMIIANLQSPFTQEADRKRLVTLYGYVEIPDKAGRLLEGYLADGSIERDPETLRQLGEMWLMARNRAKAKAVLEEAADAASDGRTWQLLGGLYFEDEEWEEAYSAFLAALDQGGLEEPQRLSLLAGISAYRAGMTQEARSALEAAAEDEELRPQAEGLLRNL